MRRIRLAVICLAWVLFTGLADAIVPPDYGFFKGKVINYIVATKPGGGNDAYGRLIGKYLQKHIPGATVIVKNVPGAGFIIGANDTYLAKPDGLTIGTFGSSLAYSQILGFPGIRFDLGKFSWIGNASSETYAFIVTANSPYKSFKDILESKEPVKVGAAGVGTSGYNDTLILAAATGAKLKVIPGYGGGAEVNMAMIRGEVAGRIGSYTGLVSLVKTKQFRVLLQIGEKRHKDLKDVPLASELEISERGKQILAVVSSTAELGRLTVGPPNMPAGRIQVLRDAYRKALNDPELLNSAARFGLDIEPAFGEDAGKHLKEAMNQPPENLEILRKIIKYAE